GYLEVYPPAMVKRECLVGTGNLPKFGDNLYRDAEEDLWFVPTAEVPVTNLYRDEVLEAERLPIRHVAYTPCFRRDKMSAGRDAPGSATARRRVRSPRWCTRSMARAARSRAC